MNNRNIVIRLTNVSKQYVIHHEKPTLIESVLHQKKEHFYAVQSLTLDIKKGEKVGFIGPNGSGKTTLLKIITGITNPTHGTVQTYGKIVSLINLEAGFHPDLTGVQNIFLNGKLLGMKRAEIQIKLNQIIRFADIGRFIDVPLFTYSEGMKLRLGFSIAIHADPDILILDEEISVGDKNFQKKSQNKIQDFFRMEKTILVVTHWLDFLKHNCDRIIVLDKGRVIKDGSKKLVTEYQNS